MDDIQIMHAILELKNTDGWQIIEQFIKDKMEDSKSRLLKCELKDVIKHRSRYESFKQVLFYIDSLITKGKEQLKNER